MPIFLTHIEGSKVGQLESFDKDQIRIGRQLDNDLSFDPKLDISVSGYHAEIYRDGERYFIRDLQSRNGTLVNTRKIDKPVQLKDGDVIQLSARGPKLSFSTRDPSAVADVSETQSPENAPTEVFAMAPKAQGEPKAIAAAWERWRPYVPVATGVVILLLMVAVGQFYWQLPWWKLLIGLAVVVLVAGGGYLTWRWRRRRKAASAEDESAKQDRQISIGKGDHGGILDIKKKWVEVLASLRQSKLKGSGDDPIYAFPWFLVIGEPGSGKSALLKASAPLSSIGPSSAEGGTRNIDWWFFEKVVLLDTAGGYVFQEKEGAVAAEWQTLLSLLKTNRGREPINGVVVAVPADSLIAKPIDKLKEQGAQLRERLDDLVQQLGVKFPVYIAVTKSDRIVGFTEFFQLLPDKVKGQALGFANQEMTSASDASRLFDRGFRMLFERLERLRLAVLNECENENSTRGMFLFPGELKSLQVPLKALIEVVFRSSPYHDAPFFRGLFLTSARQGATPLSRVSHLLGQNYSHTTPATASRDVFLRDIGAVILPADRSLIGQTATGRERYGLTRAAGAVIVMAASLLACGVLTLSFSNNWFALKSLDVLPCVNREGGNELATALGSLDECRRNIDNLLPSSFWKRLAMNFGLNESRRVARVLQDRFVDNFRSQALATIDARIDQNLTVTSANPMVVGTVMQRIQILGRCLNEGRCAALQPGQNLDYRVLLTSGQGSQDSVAMTTERLRRTHHAYLTWQNETALRDMQAKDTDRIQKWLDGGGLREDRILDSASAAFPAVRAADFWDTNGPSQVDPAYTAKAWREGIAPLIVGLQSMTSKTSGVAESLKSFETNYRVQALRQWEEFLSSYPQMERLASQKRTTKEIALALESEKSPAITILQSAYDNLSVILGPAWQSGELPPWVATLKKFMVVKTKVVETQKIGKPASQDGAQGREVEAAKILTSYLSALDQIKADLSTSEKSFASAKKAFEEGEASSSPTQGVLKADGSLNMLRATIGTPQQEDRLVWIVLGSPISVGWKAILEESGKHLQQQWEGLLLEVKDLDPGPKGGKIISFVNGSATSFLSRSGGVWIPKRVLNQTIPFTDAFVQYLTRLSADARQPSASSPPVFATPTGSGPQPPPYIVRNS